MKTKQLVKISPNLSLGVFFFFFLNMPYDFYFVFFIYFSFLIMSDGNLLFLDDDD